MLSVSNQFKERMKRRMKEIDAYLLLEDGTKLTSFDDLVLFKISCEAGLCKTAMRKLEVTHLGSHNLLGQWIHVGYGVKLETGEFEYVDYGSFRITEMTVSKDKDTTSLVGYDRMLLSMTEYTPLSITYPINLYDYTKALCNRLGIDFTNDTFPNAEWLITQELWGNIDGITYRDILVQIAQATGTVCIIGNDDKIHFKSIVASREKMTYSDLRKLKLEPIYGEINSVVLGRDPIVGEDIFLKDDDSIAANGLTEFRIVNNEIIDKDRENAIIEIYNALHGISFYPFEATTEGFGWFEIGDSFSIVSDSSTYNTTLFNYSVTIDGAIKETLKTAAETKTQSQYQYASKITRRIRNTEIEVNKQEQYIKQLVSDVYEEDGIINEKFTNIFQDIDNIINSVQNSGGSNLIYNSVMFAMQNGIPENWAVTGDGTLLAQSSPEAFNAGSQAGHTFTLLDKTVKQRVYVKPDEDSIPEDQKTYYTFSCKIKKNIVGTCYVKLSNSVEEHIIKLDSGQESFYGDYELKALLPKESYYDIEFYGSFDSNATFTDVMFALGQYKTTWTQANGEIMNTQVVINQNGALVKSSVYEGDYTVMSPLEFAGYSKINGVVTKVFSLNKDTTEVKKLRVEDEVTMPPIKIVPIKTGAVTGWALVKTGDVK